MMQTRELIYEIFNTGLQTDKSSKLLEYLLQLKS